MDAQHMKHQKRTLHLSFRGWLLTILVLLILVVAYFIVADRITPSTNDAHVQAYVVQIAPQVSGRVIKIYVKDNRHVTRNAPLFTVDPRPYAHEAQKLGAMLVQVQHKIKQLKTTLTITKELIKQRQADLIYAKEHFNEFRRLVKEGAAARIKLQQFTDQLTEKKERLRQAKSLLLKTQQKLSALVKGKHASVKIVMAQLATAKLHLSETTVYAPFDGIVSNMRLTHGGYANIGTPILTLIASHVWWVVANIKENNLSRITIGDPVDVSFSIYPGETFPATVDSLGRGVNLLEGTPKQYLPHIKKTANWVRLAQRFPVKIKLTHYNMKKYPLNNGATALVTIYTDKAGFIHGMGYVIHRIRSFFNYIV